MIAFDLLITDYSSGVVELLFLIILMLFITSDLEEYLKNRGIIFGNYDFWMECGPKVDNIKDLYNEIFQLLENENYYIKERNKYRNLWFGDLKDGGCKDICDYIFDGNSIRKDFPRYNSKVLNLTEKVEVLEEISRKKDDIIDARNARIRELDDFIRQIINSKGWKFLEKMRDFKKIFNKN